MQAVTTIGLDIAKSVFQVHGVDAAGLAGVRQRSATFTPQKLPKAAQINSPWELNHWNCWRSLGDSNPCFRRERARATGEH